MGDFNLHVNDCSGHRATEFMDLVTSLDFSQHVKEATHNQGNTLDLIFTRKITTNLLSIIQVPVSDHYCILFNVALCFPTKSRNPEMYTYWCIDSNAKSLIDFNRLRVFTRYSSHTLASTVSLDNLTDNLNNTLKVHHSVAPPKNTETYPHKICTFVL